MKKTFEEVKKSIGENKMLSHRGYKIVSVREDDEEETYAIILANNCGNVVSVSSSSKNDFGDGTFKITFSEGFSPLFILELLEIIGFPFEDYGYTHEQ